VAGASRGHGRCRLGALRAEADLLAQILDPLAAAVGARAGRDGRRPLPDLALPAAAAVPTPVAVFFQDEGASLDADGMTMRQGGPDLAVCAVDDARAGSARHLQLPGGLLEVKTLVIDKADRLELIDIKNNLLELKKGNALGLEKRHGGRLVNMTVLLGL
jgi:hypothetical protein